MAIGQGRVGSIDQGSPVAGGGANHFVKKALVERAENADSQSRGWWYRARTEPRSYAYPPNKKVRMGARSALSLRASQEKLLSLMTCLRVSQDQGRPVVFSSWLVATRWWWMAPRQIGVCLCGIYLCDLSQHRCDQPVRRAEA